MFSVVYPEGDVRRTSAGVAETVWIDAHDPTQDEMEELAHRFNWHPLSVEDALKPHQRAKLDRYENHYFLVLYTVHYVREELALTELDIFLGPQYVVTVHREPLAELLEEARQRWGSHPYVAQRRDPISLVYVIADTVVDSFMPVVDAISNQIGEMEERLFENFRQELLQDTLAMRRDLMNLRRVVGPTRDAVDSLMRSDVLMQHPDMLVYFGDIHDHLLRLTESLDLQRELLGNILEGYLSLVSNNLNQVMKVLTALATLLMVLALIAGIYGMNFENMPELGWRYSYFLILGIMALVGGGLIVFFRRRGWL